jgi:hypothetical protein
MEAQLFIRRRANEGAIRVGGNIDADSAAAFARVLAHDVPLLSRGRGRIVLELGDLELDDGPAVAEAVNALRVLLQGAPVTLRETPQLLAHVLYKAGMLRSERLQLEATRDEEARSA